MMRLAAIWRHPIKSHGREALGSVTLAAGATLPWDRRWAVAHEAAQINRDTPAWAECVNFSRGAKAPRLMALNAVLDEATATLTLAHPDRPTLTFPPRRPRRREAVPGLGAAALPARPRPARGSLFCAGPGNDRHRLSLDLGPEPGLERRSGGAHGGAAVTAALAQQPLSGGGRTLGRNRMAGKAPADRRRRVRGRGANRALCGHGGQSGHRAGSMLTLAGLRTETGAQAFGVYARVLRGGTGAQRRSGRGAGMKIHSRWPPNRTTHRAKPAA